MAGERAFPGIKPKTGHDRSDSGNLVANLEGEVVGFDVEVTGWRVL